MVLDHEGMQFARPLYLSPYFLTNAERVAELEDPSFSFQIRSSSPAFRRCLPVLWAISGGQPR